MKKAKQIFCFIVLISLVSAFFVGCSVNDSLNSGDEVEALKIHSSDEVYKIYYLGSCDYFISQLYNGEKDLDSLNKKLLDPHLKKGDPELQEIPCEGHGYIIACSDVIVRYVGTCGIGKLYTPKVLKYVVDSSQVFDNSVDIKEVYILIPFNLYINEYNREYVYYVTDKGDYIFIYDKQNEEGVYYLVPADEYGKHCAEVYETHNFDGVIGSYNFVTSFENIESYRHTEPFKPE